MAVLYAVVYCVKSGAVSPLGTVMGILVHLVKAARDAASKIFSSCTFLATSAAVETHGLNYEKSVGGFHDDKAAQPVKVGVTVTCWRGWKVKAL